MSAFNSFYASFGSTKTGLATVEYQQVGAGGAVLVAATTVGVYEVGGGVYGVDVVLAIGCKALLWNTGEAIPIFATEDMLDNFNKQALVSERHTDPGTGVQTIFEETDDTTPLVAGAVTEDVAGTTPYSATSNGIDRQAKLT